MLCVWLCECVYVCVCVCVCVRACACVCVNVPTPAPHPAAAQDALSPIKSLIPDAIKDFVDIDGAVEDIISSIVDSIVDASFLPTARDQLSGLDGLTSLVPGAAAAAIPNFEETLVTGAPETKKEHDI